MMWKTVVTAIHTTAKNLSLFEQHISRYFHNALCELWLIFQNESLYSLCNIQLYKFERMKLSTEITQTEKLKIKQEDET